MTDGSARDDKTRWSADGRLLYFLSTRGGLANVWAVEMDAATGTPKGQPFAVTQFNGPGEQIAPQIQGVVYRSAGVAVVWLNDARAALGVSRDTVMRDWQFARDWLRREMRGAGYEKS